MENKIENKKSPPQIAEDFLSVRNSQFLNASKISSKDFLSLKLGKNYSRKLQSTAPSLSNKEIIKLREVYKIYQMGENRVNALCEINISIKDNDFVAIMGPSGSGKSTGMNLIGSLDMPTRGEIYLDGHDIAHLEESQLAQIRGKKIGFIFQSFNLIPNLTAKENVMLPMIFQDTEKEARERKADDLLKLVELGDRMEHYPNQLSGGQQQRVAIARALANDPEVILADEPTGNLDTKTGEMVMQFLQQLNEKGKTIIMVTHSPELAQRYAKKIFWLKDGEVDKVTIKDGNGWKEIRNL